MNSDTTPPAESLAFDDWWLTERDLPIPTDVHWAQVYSVAKEAYEAALAVPLQEPAAWINGDDLKRMHGTDDPLKGAMVRAVEVLDYDTALYAAPLQAAPAIAEPSLSDARIEQLWRATFSTNNPFCPCDLKSFTKTARVVEAVLKREALAAPLDAPKQPLGDLTARSGEAGRRPSVED